MSDLEPPTSGSDDPTPGEHSPEEKVHDLPEGLLPTLPALPLLPARTTSTASERSPAEPALTSESERDRPRTRSVAPIVPPAPTAVLDDPDRPNRRLRALAAAVAIAALVALGILAFSGSGSGPELTTTIDRSIGTGDKPFAYDTLVPIAFDSPNTDFATTWNVQAGQLRDITGDVMSTNPFNQPPDTGIRFVGFDIEMTLATATRAPFVNSFEWEIFGAATGETYGPRTMGIGGCGVVEDAYNSYRETFVGDTVKGVVCIPLPTEDFDNSDTAVVVNFGDTKYIFDVEGESPSPVAVNQPIRSLRSYGSAGPATIVSLGPSDQSVWNVRADAPETADEVRTRISRAPIGFQYVDFHVEMTLASAATEPLTPGSSFTWEVVGGVTGATYEVESGSCPVRRSDLNSFAEVFVGGTLQGQVCVPIAIDDVDHPETLVGLRFSGERSVFTPDPPQTEPARIDDQSPGPPGAGFSLAFGEPDQVPDPSVVPSGTVWTSTVTRWTDATEEVDPQSVDVPDGVILAAFDAELTLDVIGTAATTAPSNDFEWEILGGATNRVYTANTFWTGCRILESNLDMFAQSAVGDTLAGTVCIPIPAEDFAHPDTRIAMNFYPERIIIAPNQ